MKYKSELLSELIEKNGHVTTKIPHYESECENEFINEVRGAYPKLCDYSGEWLNYANNHVNIGKFPTERVVNVTNARFENVVPYGYKSAILKGQTLVNVASLYQQHYSYSDYNLTFIDKTKTYFIKFNTTFETSQIGFIVDNNTWNINIQFEATTNGYVKIKPNETKEINRLRIRFNGNTDHSFIPTANLICVEYQEGMENWDIPYFEGMQSVKMPVLTTTNEDGTKTNILSTPSDLELRGIGEGSNRVEDELDCLTGEVTERVGEIVLDGCEDWRVNKETETHISYYLTINSNMKKLFKALTNSLPSYEWGNVEDLSKECFWSFTSSYGMIVSKAECPTIEEFKQKLSRNPVILQYELDESTIKTVDLSCLDENNNPTKFKPYEGVMYVVTSSETLPPLLDMEIPVEAINQNLMSFIK